MFGLTRRTPRPSGTLRCSFCNKSEDEVAKLIAGPKVYICGDCVDVCVDILATSSEAPVASAQVLCPVCRHLVAIEDAVSINERSDHVCPACIRAIRTTHVQGLK